MAVKQTLKGNTKKIYSVMANFNQGIDKNTADDVASDTSFRELINFYNANEGALSKRKGAYNSNFTDFIKAIVTEAYSEKFIIGTNDYSEQKATVIPRLLDFYNTILKCIEKSNTVTYTSGGQSVTETRYFVVDKILGMQVLKNSKFLEALEDYENILDGEYSNIAGTGHIEFLTIIVAGGFSEIKVSGESNRKEKSAAFYITRLHIIMDYTEGTGYNVKIECDSVDPTISNSPKRRWLYYPENYNFELGKADQYISSSEEYKPLVPIDMETYNGYTYMATGKDYLIQIDQTPTTKTTHATYTNESSIFKIFSSDETEGTGLNVKNTIYKPTAIELYRIGFNILSSNPTSFYDTESGATNKIKGFFCSVTITRNGNTFQQPVLKVPYNKPFTLNIIKTGSATVATPEYRDDNGETDLELNPYKPLPGAWKSGSNTIWECTGINSDIRQEVKITLGTDTDIFINYIETTSSSIDETGYVEDISKLVYASTRLKVINDQLILYNKHGYMFFSELGVFNYFPNYNYIYVANEAGEESVTSINYFRQYYAIFTNKRIKKMTGSWGTSNFGIYPLNDFIGCPIGRTVRAVGNNLLFVGNDGIYRLKQGYLGEGTENVEKIDAVLDNAVNLNNTIQAFTMNNNYIVVKNDGKTWIIYDEEIGAFYEYNLESNTAQVYVGEHPDTEITKKVKQFYSIFETTLYDSYGDFFLVPMYDYTYNSGYTVGTLSGIDLMLFRFADVDYIGKDKAYKDGVGFISSLETHNLTMGYPTNTKKFKDVYIKMINESGHAIPLYVTIYVDDKKVVDPEYYDIIYDGLTNTYYYAKKTESNKELLISRAIGEFTLGDDPIGGKTIQQIKMRVGSSGRSIRIILRDGYNDTTELDLDERGLPQRERNIYDFAITSIGISYKVKKVKEG